MVKRIKLVLHKLLDTDSTEIYSKLPYMFFVPVLTKGGEKMHHVGKVLQVLSHKNSKVTSSDNTTQAVVEMWDGPRFIFDVEQKIENKIKESDFVIVDYTPQKNHAPKHYIIKILDKKIGEKTWKSFKEFIKQQEEIARKRMPQKEPEIASKIHYT